MLQPVSQISSQQKRVLSTFSKNQHHSMNTSGIVTSMHSKMPSISKNNLSQEESQGSLGYNASVTDLLPAPDLEDQQETEQKKFKSVDVQNLKNYDPNVTLLPQSPPMQPVMNKQVVVYKIDSASRGDTPPADTMTAKFDQRDLDENSLANDQYQYAHRNMSKERQNLFPEQKDQQRDLIQFTFKTSDCFELKEYDRLVKLISKYDYSKSRSDLQSNKATASKLVKTIAGISKLNRGKKQESDFQISPRSKISSTNINQLTNRTNSTNQSLSIQQLNASQQQPVKISTTGVALPSSKNHIDRGFFALRSKHKLPLPGIPSTQRRNPANTGAERQFRKKLKDLVVEIGQQIKDMHSSFREQEARVKRGSLSAIKPRPTKQLSPVRLRQLREEIGDQIIAAKHQKTKSVFIQRALAMEQEKDQKEKRAYQSKCTMRPTPAISPDLLSQTMPSQRPQRDSLATIKQVKKNFKKLPPLKPNMLSPHLLKIYKDDQQANKNKELLLDILKKHQFSTKKLHQQSSKTALQSDSVNLLLQSSISSNSGMIEEYGAGKRTFNTSIPINKSSIVPQYRVHVNTITNDVILNKTNDSIISNQTQNSRQQSIGVLLASTIGSRTPLQDALIATQQMKITQISASPTNLRASPHSGLESKLTQNNDQAFGVAPNNPIRKLARDLTALIDLPIGPGTNAKWVANTIKSLIKMPFFTGECNKDVNSIDPNIAMNFASKKKKISKQRSVAGRLSSAGGASSFMTNDDGLIKELQELMQELRTGGVIEVIWNQKAVIGGPPGARQGATMGFARNRLFLFGGFSQDRFNDTRAVQPEMAQQNFLGSKQWSWEYLDCDIFLPTKRFGHTMVMYDDKFFVFGGGGGYKTQLKYRQTYGDLNIFLCSESRWQKGIKPSGNVEPSNRINHAACELGSIMLMYGGYWGEQKQVLSDFYALDLHGIQWFNVFLLPVGYEGKISTPQNKSRSQTKHPLKGRFGHTMTSVIPPFYYSGGNASFWVKGAPGKRANAPTTPLTKINQHNKFGFYVFGGLNQSHVPTNDLWILRPVPRKMREYFIKFLQPGTEQNKTKNQIPLWQPDTNIFLEYQKVETMGKGPSPRSGHAAAFINKKYLMIYGGKNIDIFKQQNLPGLNDMHLLDLQTLCWQKVAMHGNPPSPRWGHSMTSFNNDEMALFGGVNFYGFCQSSTFHLITSKQIDGILGTKFNLDKQEVKTTLRKAKQKIDECSGKKK